MTHDFAAAMRRATDLVRAGNPAAATHMIQSQLGNTNVAQPQTSQTTPGAAKLAKKSPKTGLRDTLARLAAKARTAPDAPDLPLPNGARFDSGTFTCAAGSRAYRVYIPNPTLAPPAGLIMMLHGCTQSPVDFANGTDMNRLADAHNLIVVYPAQSRAANMQSCWNWFGPADQNRDAGEPAILAALAQTLRQAHGVPQGRVFVAGLSAGAAMAVILGHTYPDTFAAIGAHSGLPYKSAHDVPSAFAAMGGDAAQQAPQADHAIATIIFHGDADSTVNAVNGQHIADAARPPAGTELVDDGTQNGRNYTRTTMLSAAGHPVMEHWRIAGLGHAWSGGKPAGSYTDPTGPDASAEMVRFFLETPLKGA